MKKSVLRKDRFLILMPYIEFDYVPPVFVTFCFLDHALGLSRAEVAEAIGVSHQQVLKYENNINRISSGRLDILSKFLKTPIVKLMSSD